MLSHRDGRRLGVCNQTASPTAKLSADRRPRCSTVLARRKPSHGFIFCRQNGATVFVLRYCSSAQNQGYCYHSYVSLWAPHWRRGRTFTRMVQGLPLGLAFTRHHSTHGCLLRLLHRFSFPSLSMLAFYAEAMSAWYRVAWNIVNDANSLSDGPLLILQLLLLQDHWTYAE